MQNLIHGVDVSHYQSAIDWKLALSMGKRFCVAKASDGLSDNADSMFAKHRSASKEAGLIFGAYHFLRFDNNPITQAKTLLKITGGVLPGELPLTVDVEWDNRSKNGGYHDGGHLDDAGANTALTCLEYLEKETGIAPIIYTSNAFFYGFKNPERFSRFIPWIAHYTSSVEKVKTPKPWKAPVFWQYSDNEHIKGVQAIDGDAFLGSFEDLQKLTLPRKDGPGLPEAPKPGLDLGKENVALFQRGVNYTGYTPALKVDGVFGPKTRAALIAVANS
jgi:lysozyme